MFQIMYSLLDAMAEAVSMVESENESTESVYSSEESEPEYDTEELAMGALHLSMSQDGDGVHKSIFLEVYDQLKGDPVMDSDVGPSVLELLKCIQVNCARDNPSTRQLISILCIRAQSCVNKASGCKLASSIAARVWPALHQLRFNADLHRQWKYHLSTICSDADSMKYSIHALQILLDRLVKLFISKRKESSYQAPAPAPSTNEITPREMNAVHYMAGYVTAKLTKRYQKKPANKVAQKKNHMFVSVLKDMVVSRVDVDTGDYDAMEWTELIDRGGLTHVKTEVG